MKLEVKIIGVIALIALLFVAPLSVWDYKHITNEMVSNIMQKVDAHGEKESLKITRYFDKINAKNQTLASVLEGLIIEKPMINKQVNIILESFLLDNDDFLGVWVSVSDPTDSLDMQICWRNIENVIQIDTSFQFNEELYQKVVTQKSCIITPPRKRIIIGKDYFSSTIIEPVYVGGNYCGMIGIDIDLSSFQKKINEIKPLNIGKAFLISNDGVIIAHPDARRLTKNITQTELDLLNTKKTERFLDAIKKGQKYSLLSYSKSLNDFAFKMIIPVKISETKTTWSLGFIFPENPIQQILYQNHLNTFIRDAILIVIFSMLVFLSIKKILAPVKKAINQIEQLAEGNTRNFIKTKILHKKNEIGRLLRAISTIQEKYNEYIDLEKNKQIKQQWRIKGKNNLARILRSDVEVIELFQQITSFVVKFFDGLQGAIYYAHKETQNLVLIGKYALIDEQLENEIIKFEDGIVGEAAYQKKYILLTDLKKNQNSKFLINISYRNLLVFPIVHNNETLAVIEIGSFNPIKQEYIDFLNEMNDPIARAIFTSVTLNKVKNIIYKSQKND